MQTMTLKQVSQRCADSLTVCYSQRLRTYPLQSSMTAPMNYGSGSETVNGIRVDRLLQEGRQEKVDTRRLQNLLEIEDEFYENQNQPSHQESLTPIEDLKVIDWDQYSRQPMDIYDCLNLFGVLSEEISTFPNTQKSNHQGENISIEYHTENCIINFEEVQEQVSIHCKSEESFLPIELSKWSRLDNLEEDQELNIGYIGYQKYQQYLFQPIQPILRYQCFSNQTFEAEHHSEETATKSSLSLSDDVRPQEGSKPYPVNEKRNSYKPVNKLAQIVYFEIMKKAFSESYSNNTMRLIRILQTLPKIVQSEFLRKFTERAHVEIGLTQKKKQTHEDNRKKEFMGFKIERLLNAIGVIATYPQNHELAKIRLCPRRKDAREHKNK